MLPLCMLDSERELHYLESLFDLKLLGLRHPPQVQEHVAQILPALL